MKRLVTLAEGARAAEELAEGLLGFSIHKAIDPLTDSGFLLIGETIAEKLAKSAHTAETAAVALVLAELDIDWAGLTEEALEAAYEAIRAAIAKYYIAQVVPSVEVVLLSEGISFMRLVRVAMNATSNLGIQTSLSQRDINAEAALRKSHLNFIRDSSGLRAEALSAKARDIVASGLSNGYGTDTIGQQLESVFREDIPRPESYWRVVADAFVGRARARSQIDALADAGIETYELVAVLDEVTTDICRMMDGKVFQVSAAQKFLSSLDSLEDPEDIKYVQPWVRKGRDPDGDGDRLYVPNKDGSTTTIAKIDRSGVGGLDDRGEYSGQKSISELMTLGIPCPPFHGKCRTVIVAGADTSV